MYVFFQAEDGIRDLVRSRGLGDVYKRQRYIHLYEMMTGRTFTGAADDAVTVERAIEVGLRTVSYTHLTLPTSDLV